MADKFGLQAALKSFESTKRTLPKILGNMALNHFKKSFRDGGFTNQNLVRWKPRKIQDKGRAILVKSGALRASLSLRVATWDKIKIATDLPYAAIHNFGLQGKAFGKYAFQMPKRQFVGRSIQLERQMRQKIDERIGIIFR